MEKDLEKFDVVVIGGGPAGLIAAGRAAELGSRVLLLEKSATLGRKLLITGKGRCNVTQANCENNQFVEKLGKKGKFLYSALSRFGFSDMIDFLNERGVETKVERGGRVFPSSDEAKDVLKALRDYMNEGAVKIHTGKKVIQFNLKNGRIDNIETQDGKIVADKYIIATGGKSYPVTGSTGDGYQWAASMGHSIVEAEPALVPVRTKDGIGGDLQGLSLKNVQINVVQDGKKVDSRFGEMMFTHYGLSGPIVLDVSKRIGEALKDGAVAIELDLKPALEFSQLEKRLQRDFEKNINKSFKNYLPDLLPRKMIGFFMKASGIDPEKNIGTIGKDERKKMTHLLKEMRFDIKELLGFEHAIITTGGVELKEVDSKTMQSRKVENLYFAGEVLDLDAPTGGYNLQVCWSTGYAAGEGCAE
ncbi:NAD(P)/FAD-dependent oxidoreductase [Patescibacteria group bacterium]